MGCIERTKAERVYQGRFMRTMSVYVLLVLVVTSIVRHGHVRGWLLYVLAVVPSLAIFKLLHVVAMYLREETDEFQRDGVVRSILWGTAVLLAVSAVTDFLRGYTLAGDLPPFMNFTIFWIVFAIAQFAQQRMNRVTGDE